MTTFPPGNPTGPGSINERGDIEQSPSLISDDLPRKGDTLTIVSQLKAILFNSRINILLFCVPAGFAVYYTQGNSVASFVVNFFAIIPLSDIGEFALREVGLHNKNAAGFLYITLCNFVQLVSSILLLKGRQVSVLQTSLIGGILSNILLMLGLSFLIGGLNRLEQHYNPLVAHTSANLLSLASTSLLIPTAAHLLSQTTSSNLTRQSRGGSVVLLCVYFAYLFFQYKSHTEGFNRPSPKVEERRQAVIAGDASREIARVGQMSATAAMGGKTDQIPRLIAMDEEEEEPQLHILVALGTLIVSATLTAFATQFMVDSVDALSQKANISKTFIGLILLPILNNDLSPLRAAVADKMDETVLFTIGKCLQTALFVTPFTVLLAWPMGVDNMTLNFNGFEIVSLFASILLINYLISDAKSTWIQGVLLLADWVLIAIAAFFAESTP